MTRIKDEKPANGQDVIVQTTEGYAIASYYDSVGFCADSDGYDIYAHDDSGLEITIDGDVINWWPLPKEGKDD